MSTYMDRETGRMIDEEIVKKGLFHWLYNTNSGKRLRPFVLHSKLIHLLTAKYCDSTFSKHLIPKFVKVAKVNVDEAEKPISKYNSFNEFFTRKLKPECRPIDIDPLTLISPADGKLLVVPEISENSKIIIKGIKFNIKELLQSNLLSKKFEGGSCIVVRLYLGDYHRTHFPLNGVPGSPRFIKGQYYSVSPFFGNNTNFYCLNHRSVTEFKSDLAGFQVFVEIGGFLISSINHTYKANIHVKKGKQKGWFAFGGSTIVALFEKERIKYDSDLEQNSLKGIETYVKLGRVIGKCI